MEIFPDEIWVQIFQSCDLKTKANIRKSCHYFNFIFPNPKSIDRKIFEEWDERFKKILGLTLIYSNLSGQITMRDPTKNIDRFIFIKKFNDTEDFIRDRIVFCFDNYMNNVIQKIVEKFEIIQCGYETFESLLYGLFCLNDNSNIFENLDYNADFLYEMMIQVICYFQKKNKQKVLRNNFSQILNKLLNSSNSGLVETQKHIRTFKFLSIEKIDEQEKKTERTRYEPSEANVILSLQEEYYRNWYVQDEREEKKRLDKEKIQNLSKDIETKIQDLFQRCMMDCLRNRISCQEMIQFYRTI
jgi:hypothetical protein